MYRLEFAMSGPEFEQTESAADTADAPTACVELVPITPSLQWANSSLPRPDPCFVTQLIATAEQAPQTRSLRRATPADAQFAYTAGKYRIRVASVRTRHII
jgi:hypothetical protein